MPFMSPLASSATETRAAPAGQARSSAGGSPVRLDAADRTAPPGALDPPQERPAAGAEVD
jgi:hypothetical protein